MTNNPSSFYVSVFEKCREYFLVWLNRCNPFTWSRVIFDYILKMDGLDSYSETETDTLPESEEEYEELPE
jgi:hypothetical protein